ncbi:MAG TPA: hydantoinase B/oxoprolinase family protein, partial [Candidatus Limnocylindrales bacterium]|nr:hydantoinase B/oxoprolinase family protein [Candidatus Limnocylindrales bacterium]
DEMGALVRRAAFSLVVSEGGDYSGTISNRHGDLVASGVTDLAAHLGTIPSTVKGTLEWIGVPAEEYFRPGDIVLINDPYIGGTHHNDMRAVMPVYFRARSVAFIQSSMHWTDIGGHVPGTFDPNARASYGEGLAVPPVHIVREGVFQSEMADIILRNIRLAQQARGDLLTMIGAVRLGERRMQELADRYGPDTIETAMDELIAYSEQLLREELRKLPDGTWDVEQLMDRDPGSDSDDPIAARMTLTIEGDHAQMDFSRSSGPAKGAMNSSRAVTISSTVVHLKMIFPHIPMNQGVFRAIDFVLPEGTLLSAVFPAPVSGCAAGVYPAVGDLVLKAFIQLIPERCMAGPTGLLNIVMGGEDGRPGHEGQDFVMYLWLEGGWGGRLARKDNAVAMTTFATTATNQPVELHERLTPVLFECYRIEQDSAGAGWHRGAPGVTRRWSFPHGDVVLSDLGDGEKFGPWGFAGGRDARPNRFIYAPGTDEELNVGMFRTNLPVKQGRLLDCFQPGGGGYGDPLARPVDYVIDDVLDGFVSLEGAARDYGVALRLDPETGEPVVDAERTRELRAGAAPAPEWREP